MTRRRPTDYLQERVVLNHAHPAVTATTELVLFKAKRAFVVESVHYVNDTGLVADVTNFYAITLQNAAVVLATWSTETGQEGALTAATFADPTLSVVAGVLSLAAGDVLKLVLTEDGTQTLPAGQLQIEGRYL